MGSPGYIPQPLPPPQPYFASPAQMPPPAHPSQEQKPITAQRAMAYGPGGGWTQPQYGPPAGPVQYGYAPQAYGPPTGYGPRGYAYDYNSPKPSSFLDPVTKILPWVIIFAPFIVSLILAVVLPAKTGWVADLSLPAAAAVLTIVDRWRLGSRYHISAQLMERGWIWGLGTMLLMPVVTPIYLYKRGRVMQTGKAPMWVFLGVYATFISFAFAGAFISALSTTPGSHKQPGASSAGTVSVVYDASGSSTAADITYTIPDGTSETQTDVAIPLVNNASGRQEGVLVDLPATVAPAITVTTLDGAGTTVSCSIQVDGTVIVTDTSQTTAVCKARPLLNGNSPTPETSHPGDIAARLTR